jgi:hypothetical protein
MSRSAVCGQHAGATPQRREHLEVPGSPYRRRTGTADRQHHGGGPAAESTGRQQMATRSSLWSTNVIPALASRPPRRPGGTARTGRTSGRTAIVVTATTVPRYEASPSSSARPRPGRVSVGSSSSVMSHRTAPAQAAVPGAGERAERLLGRAASRSAPAHARRLHPPAMLVPRQRISASARPARSGRSWVCEKASRTWHRAGRTERDWGQRPPSPEPRRRTGATATGQQARSGLRCFAPNPPVAPQFEIERAGQPSSSTAHR